MEGWKEGQVMGKTVEEWADRRDGGRWRGWLVAGTERGTEGQVGGVEGWMEAQGKGGWEEGSVGRTKRWMEGWKDKGTVGG